MAPLVHIVNQTRPASAIGTTDMVLSSLPFEPKAVLVFGANQTAANSVSSVAVAEGGVWFAARAGAQNTVRAFGIGIYLDNADTTPDHAITAATTIQRYNADAEVLDFKSVDIAFGADSITINFLASNYDTQQEYLTFVIFGGDIDGRVPELLFPVTSAHVPGTVFEVPLGDTVFSPSAIFTTASLASGSLSAGSLGIYTPTLKNGVPQQWCMSFGALVGSDPTDFSKRLSNDCSIYVFNDVAAQHSAAPALVAKVTPRANGIAYEVVTNNLAGGEVVAVFGGAITGVDVDLVEFTKSTNTSVPVTQDVTTIADPIAGLFIGSNQTALNTGNDEISFGIGASIGTVEGAMQLDGPDNVGTSTATSRHATHRGFVASLSSTADVALGDRKFTLTWQSNTTTASKNLAVTFFETTPLSGASLSEIVTSTPEVKPSHPLTGSLTVRQRQGNPSFLGNANVQTAVWMGTHLSPVTMTVSGTLRLDHTEMLSGDVDLVITLDHFWPEQLHALTGTAEILVLTNAPYLVGVDQILSGAVSVLFDADGTLSLAMVFRGTSEILISTESLGLFGTPLPEPNQLGEYDIPGTVNLFRNPDFEVDLLDVTNVGAGSVMWEDVDAWHGEGHVRKTF